VRPVVPVCRVGGAWGADTAAREREGAVGVPVPWGGAPGAPGAVVATVVIRAAYLLLLPHG